MIYGGFYLFDEIYFRHTPRFDNRIAIDYVYQDLSVSPGLPAPVGRSKPWGTGHAILAASNAIETPFAVINADDWYGRERFSALSRHLQADTGECAMVGFTLRKTFSEFGSVARGICQVDRSGGRSRAGLHQFRTADPGSIGQR